MEYMIKRRRKIKIAKSHGYTYLSTPNPRFDNERQLGSKKRVVWMHLSESEKQKRIIRFPNRQAALKEIEKIEQEDKFSTMYYILPQILPTRDNPEYLTRTSESVIKDNPILRHIKIPQKNYLTFSGNVIHLHRYKMGKCVLCGKIRECNWG